MTKQNREDAKLDTDKEALRLQSAGDAASNVATDKEALRLQGLGVVARGVAHEIANPVNIILMNAEVAQLSLPDTAGDDEIRNDLTEALAAIIKETRRLGMLAQQIYRFADAENFAGSDKIETGTLFVKARKLLGSRPDRTGIAIRLPAADSEPAKLTLLGDETSLALALALLIGQLVAAEVERIDVTAVATNGTDRLALVVSSEGLSAPPPLAGLALAEQIGTDHGGTLSATSDGFCLELPRHG